jgi:hypothetical protein
VLFLPWKTASQTAALRLQPYNESSYSRFFHFNPYLNRVVHQHLTCAEFVRLPENKPGYFKGAFIRNPYDRAYSGFRQLQKDIHEQPHAVFPEPYIRDLVMKQLAENLAQLQQASFNFDEWIALIGEEQIYEIGCNSNFPLHPSHYWTHIAGHQFVSFIGRVENFEIDFQDFLSRVEINDVSLVNANVSELQGAAADKPFGYRYANRMNARSIDKINHLFAKDFELFGYERVSPHSKLTPHHKVLV